MDQRRTETGEIDRESEAARAGRRLLLERIRLARALDESDAEYWGDATDEERARVLASLLAFADTMLARAAEARRIRDEELRYPRIRASNG